MLYLFPDAAAYIAAVFACTDDFGDGAMRFLSDKSICRGAGKQVNQRGVTMHDTEMPPIDNCARMSGVFCENII